MDGGRRGLDEVVASCEARAVGGGAPASESMLLLATLLSSVGRSPVVKPPVVILPGFGNADVDYKTPLGQPEDKGLCAALRRRGLDVTVVDVARWEWIRVAGGVLDPGFWTCEQRPDGVAYGWYVRRARETIAAASARSGARVLVVGHSAGGWLARAALGDGDEWPARETVAGLCLLYTSPSPRDVEESRMPSSA